MGTAVQGGKLRKAWWWALFALAVAGVIVFYLLTMPRTVPASELPAHTPDLANGEYMFTVGGCAECHAEPLGKCKDPKTKDKQRLSGGRCLKTPFGTFNVPNISPDKETGIGNWSTLDFVNAMKRGIAPGGVHLYPAFPYTSYQRMAYEDLIDLKAYLDTLPAVKHTTAPHELTFPYTIRRGLGLWQLLYVDGRHSSRIQNRAPKSIAGRISLRGPAIAASVIRRGILSVGSFRARPLRVRAIRKARVGPPTSRRVPTASTIGARTISPTCSRLATRRTSTWSVVPWRRFRRIWRSSSRKIALQSPPI